MADTTQAALQAMFGNNSVTASGADINQFEKTAAANDIYNQSAAPISAAKFNTTGWTPNQITGASVGQAFLGAILNQLGQRNEASQLAKVAGVLPDLYNDPSSIGVPEGVDPQAFGGLKLAAISKKEQTDSDIRKSLASQYGINFNTSTGKANLIGSDDPATNLQDLMTQLNIKKDNAAALAKNLTDKKTKESDTKIAATNGIETLDRMIKLVDTLPPTMLARSVEAHVPFTNATNFFDDQLTASASQMARQLENRVNQTLLETYKESMTRHAGDTPQDIKNRLVNAQLWLTRVAQGDTKASNLNPADFARARGVDPATLGLADSNQQSSDILGALKSKGLKKTDMTESLYHSLRDQGLTKDQISSALGE